MENVIITLVREFESKEIRDVIRRIFVRQTKISCGNELASDIQFMRIGKAEFYHQGRTEDGASGI